MPPKKKLKLGRLKKTRNAHKQKPHIIEPITGPADSDKFLADSLVGSFFVTDLETPAVAVSSEQTDSDGFTADEFYVVLCKPFKYCPDDNLDELLFAKKSRLFSELRESCRQEINDSNFMYMTNSKDIKYIQLYDSDQCSDIPRVKACVAVSRNFELKIAVHGNHIPADHVIWENVAKYCFNVDSVKKVLSEFMKYEICCGNKDSELQDLIPVGAYADSSYNGYREGQYIGSSIRSTKCNFLIYKRSACCEHCSVYRRTLMKTLARRKNVPKIATPQKNWLKSKTPNNKLTQSQKLQKIKQLKTYSQDLEEEVAKLKREIKKKISQDGVSLSVSESADMTEIMKTSENEVKQSYPDENCYQRLFWEQQLKHAGLKDKRAMRWHPSIIKWCIYLKSKSTTTYDTLRNSGFIKLPSERTLFDYTNITTKGTGFRPDVIDSLIDETEKFEGHQRIVGILQDEIRIKSDLVYDRHSGELIGFIDLGDMNNDILSLNQNDDSQSLAKYVLLFMVRGVSTNIKFPLAHFATNGVTSDQLFCLLWQAIEILEVDVGLEVLFITSDGASPNRRFIRLHKTCAGTVYKAKNMFSSEPRDIYFISDPPHLVKTTRNCFSNSFSHTQTRKMWNNDRDVSWIHIVHLYQDHCSGLYRLCPKLTKEHINISSFGAMKVKLATQVFSATVAHALELHYDDSVTETVQFIKHMNKFFDCLNVHNMSESTRKKNDNLKAYTDVNDVRLDYLTTEFLGYFQRWKDSVENRPGVFSKKQKNSMQLSYQTLDGLEITVKSVVACIRYCLGKGMSYVLTERFNQDPIEQHFGIHRASLGCNTNPTLKQFSNSTVKIRTVGSQAIAPFRGNTRRRIALPNIENTQMKKRKRKNSV